MSPLRLSLNHIHIVIASHTKTLYGIRSLNIPHHQQRVYYPRNTPQSEEWAISLILAVESRLLSHTNLNSL